MTSSCFSMRSSRLLFWSRATMATSAVPAIVTIWIPAAKLSPFGA